MAYEYVAHDNCVLRMKKGTLSVENVLPSGWVPFTDNKAFAAWYEGTPLTTAEATKRLKDFSLDVAADAE